jgi:hypothetical protein
LACKALHPPADKQAESKIHYIARSKVRISGEKSTKYKTIKADKFEVYMDGKWKTAWTQELEDAQRRQLDRG